MDVKKAQGNFLVLLAVEDGPKHGYEIAKYIEERSDGFFTISYGALYPVLHKLEKSKQIAGKWEQAGGTRKKKVYSLTRQGVAALRDERAAYEQFTLAFAKLLERNA
jgi:DNA-binding PadR family transcriptional regulator